MPQAYLPLLVGLAVAFGLGGVLLGLSWLAGVRSGGRVKRSPYESGVPLLDRARKRLSIAFFLVAIDFVVFDVEAAFLFPWVVTVREAGWPVFWAVMLFVGWIAVGFAYLWLKGGLDVAAGRLLPRREPGR